MVVTTGLTALKYSTAPDGGQEGIFQKIHFLSEYLYFFKKYLRFFTLFCHIIYAGTHYAV